MAMAAEALADGHGRRRSLSLSP
uniref:Uncharacterized protein n=1 Tax=Arundo donax TaxID=35708 RepID=A0A0A8ZMY8_ARUDO